MNRRHAVIEPQHTLPAVTACAFAAARLAFDELLSEPAHREAPPSA
jgi:hypothetical protein